MIALHVNLKLYIYILKFSKMTAQSNTLDTIYNYIHNPLYLPSHPFVAHCLIFQFKISVLLINESHALKIIATYKIELICGESDSPNPPSMCEIPLCKNIPRTIESDPYLTLISSMVLLTKRCLLQSFSKKPT